MQKRKFDELISHFNRKVSDMSIDQKYKMELLGMISAIGFAHEKELSTNLAEVGTDCISRQAAIDAIGEKSDEIYKTKQKGATYPHDDFFQGMAYAENVVKQLPPIQPEIIRCRECKFASGDSRICMKFGHSPIGELDFCAWAERRTDE